MSILNFKILKELSKNLSLLYVEDDQILREKTQIIFKNLFKKVDVAENGVEALNLYNDYLSSNSCCYDIIISDIQMPKLDGIGLTKEILKINKSQKVIIISAYNDKEYLIELINIGVEAFMQKPLSSQNMLEVLHKVCTSFSSEDKIIVLDDDFLYNLSKSTLYLNKIKVELSENELKLFHMLIQNDNQSFSTIEIFNHLYFDNPDKEFSADAIKSLVKRLRKKLPENLISNTQQLGYSISL